MDEVQRFQQIQARIDQVKDSKIRYEERYKGAVDKLEKLIKEIADKGYDPKNLAQIREQKEAELKKCMEELEVSVKEAETILATMEG